MNTLNRFIPDTYLQKSDIMNPEAEIVFFDELNFGWVMDKEAAMKTDSVNSIEKQSRELMLFNKLIDFYTEIT